MSLINISPYDYGILATFGGLIIAVIALFLEHRRDRTDIELSKKGLGILLGFVESFEKTQGSHTDLHQEILHLEQWKSLAKNAGWHLDRFESEAEKQRQPDKN